MPLCSDISAMTIGKSYIVLSLDGAIVAIMILYCRRMDARIIQGEDPFNLRNGVIAMALFGLLSLIAVFGYLVADYNGLQVIFTAFCFYLVIREKARFDEKYIKD